MTPDEQPRRYLLARPRAGCFPLLVALALTACGSEPAMVPQPVPNVVVAKVQARDITDERTFTGRVEAKEKVPLRARVQGFLVARAFDEGAQVAKGQLLYEIDKLPFELAVKQSEGNLANAEAALQLARLTFERQQDLAERGSAASSKAQLDQARAGLAQAEALKRVREAELQTAEVNLSYTRIVAPFDGRIGRSAYAVGDLVGPSGNPLATLVAQDPVYVTFPVPQRVLLDVRRSDANPDDYFVQLRLADGSLYGERGQIRFVDVQATASTDSVTVRASIPNPKGDLIDQQLVEVMVVRKRPETRLMMPQAALLLDQQGAFALVVGKEGRVEQRRISVGPQSGPLIVVESGLAIDESVVVSGHRNARPGGTVQPQIEEPASSVRAPSMPPGKN